MIFNRFVRASATWTSRPPQEGAGPSVLGTVCEHTKPRFIPARRFIPWPLGQTCARASFVAKMCPEQLPRGAGGTLADTYGKFGVSNLFSRKRSILVLREFEAHTAFHHHSTLGFYR